MTLRSVFLIPVRIYQKLISPLKKPCCRYNPSCSVYFCEAVKKHGIIKGSILGLERISRCCALFDIGNDPVPETFSFKNIRKNRKEFRIKPRRKNKS